MNKSPRLVAVSLFYLALAMILGAFAAHALKDSLSEYQQDVYFKANFYHFVASLTILVLSCNGFWQNKMFSFFLAGSLIFSGTLYLLAITGERWLGALTPIGGSLMIGILLIEAIRLWFIASKK
jgi:uncharacterized membrane protein YgdD (TMEM256/DUF423 family)